MQDMRTIIRQVQDNPRLMGQYGYLSTSEWLMLLLGVGTKSSIAKLADTSCPTIPEAWQRIGPTGQAVVLEAWKEE
jgi:hypothetical protein